MITENVGMILIGAALVVLGIFNIRGNIASIHWYNRRKVSEENVKPYGRLAGSGTLIIGAGLIITGILQTMEENDNNFMFLIVGVIVGIALIVFAQLRYNRGIF